LSSLPHSLGEEVVGVELSDYQREAMKTKQLKEGDGAVLLPLIGLAGEAGALLNEYRKYLRDGRAHLLHRDQVAEDLGDMLWYLASAADGYELGLEGIASANLQKVRNRWLRRLAPESSLGAPRLFDAAFPEHERFPRRFEVDISQRVAADGKSRVRAFLNGSPLGDHLTDNAYSSDGYRFHDAFHLAYAAVLGWSPVSRWLLKRKRKSQPKVDEVEDGGRAIVTEEGLATIIFEYAQNHERLESSAAVDGELLKLVKTATSHLEVSACSEGEWEAAFLKGFQVWRDLVRHEGGVIECDLDNRSVMFRPHG
jgi:NTP pyrophosphatase (non-canonical NTP hydrolase)